MNGEAKDGLNTVETIYPEAWKQQNNYKKIITVGKE